MAAKRELIKHNKKLLKGVQKHMLYHRQEKYMKDNEDSMKCYNCSGFLSDSSLCPSYSKKDVAMSLFPNDFVQDLVSVFFTGNRNCIFNYLIKFNVQLNLMCNFCYFCKGLNFLREMIFKVSFFCK